MKAVMRRLLNLLLGGRNRGEASPERGGGWEAEHEREQRRLEDEHGDVLKGWKFVATLDLDTPLRTLQHHGEVFEGPVEERPEYGDLSNGMWAPETKTFEELGLDVPEFPESTAMASAIGPVPADGGDFLPFLKDFRRIVESSADVPAKIQRIDQLVDKKPEYEQIAERLGRDFPEGWFARRLTVVDGIGEETAARLFRLGFYEVGDLCSSSDEELLDVSGVGPATVGAIREYCSDS